MLTKSNGYIFYIQTTHQNSHPTHLYTDHESFKYWHLTVQRKQWWSIIFQTNVVFSVKDGVSNL